jgi:hypothetical protein
MILVGSQPIKPQKLQSAKRYQSRFTHKLNSINSVDDIDPPEIINFDFFKNLPLSINLLEINFDALALVDPNLRINEFIIPQEKYREKCYLNHQIKI